MNIFEALKTAHEMLAECKNYINITLVAHVLSPRGYDNKIQINCSETEHFTVQEFNEIYQGIVTSGFFINQVFFSEFDFISDAINNPPKYSKTIVFNLCRNGTGMNKKTVVPAICDLLSIAYTSSSAGHCVISRNKKLFSSYLSANGIRCPICDTNLKTIRECIPPNDMVICKPNFGSASQGVDYKSVMTLNEVTNENNDIIIQKYINGYECEVPIFTSNKKTVVLPPVGISFENNTYTGILTGSASNASNYAFYDIENIVGSECCEQIMIAAEKSFNLIGIETYGRIDFRIDKNTHEYFLIDISTTPYITRHSSFAYAMKKQGLDYSNIFEIIIASSFCRSIKNFDAHIDKNCKSDKRNALPQNEADLSCTRKPCFMNS
jgi:D-alanine-D-alanine ligase